MAQKYNPGMPTWVKVSLEMHVRNPKPETSYLGEGGSIGAGPLELNQMLFELVNVVAEFWAVSAGGTGTELNAQIDKFRTDIAGLKFVEKCACGIWWPASDMVDGQCPECRESDA